MGAPTRALDETVQMRPAELHELIRGGRLVTSRLDEILVLLASRTVPTDDAPEPRRRPARPARESLERAFDDARAERAIAALALETSESGGEFLAPSLYLGATPEAVSTVPTIFDAGEVQQRLENPPQTRHDGWNLFTAARAEIVEGTHLRLASGRRKLVELYDDGTLQAVARFDRLLVAHSHTVGEARPLRVNCLALIEWIHDFVLAYSEIAKVVVPPPSRARFEVRVRGAIGTPVGDLFLPPGPLGSFAWEIGDPEDYPPTDTPDYTWSFLGSAAAASVGSVAFELVKHVYAFFKRFATEIPYLTPGRDAVDPAAFVRQT